MTHPSKNCKHCFQLFSLPAKYLRRTYYCSRSCAQHARYPKKENNVSCATCNTEFYRATSKQRSTKSGLFFCSQSCKYKAQRIGGIRSIMPDHFGTTAKNYRLIGFRTYEAECVGCGYNHHPKVLDVHHIDCDRSNNSPDNLLICCPTCHREYHLGLKSVDFERRDSLCKNDGE